MPPIIHNLRCIILFYCIVAQITNVVIIEYENSYTAQLNYTVTATEFLMCNTHYYRPCQRHGTNAELKNC